MLSRKVIETEVADPEISRGEIVQRCNDPMFVLDFPEGNLSRATGHP